MVDEHFNKLYREGSGELNRAVDSGIRALGASIMALSSRFTASRGSRPGLRRIAPNAIDGNARSAA
jgi:hypothetical protein